jgi:hypothetical protein
MIDFQEPFVLIVVAAAVVDECGIVVFSIYVALPVDASYKIINISSINNY